MDTLSSRGEAAIESILSSLTLEEKVSQLLHQAPVECVGAAGRTAPVSFEVTK